MPKHNTLNGSKPALKVIVTLVPKPKGHTFNNALDNLAALASRKGEVPNLTEAK